MKKAGTHRVAWLALGALAGAWILPANAADEAARVAAASNAQPSSSAPAPADPHAAAGEGDGLPAEWKFFDKYCGECHNSTDWAGGVAFDTMLPESMHDDAGVWEESVRKLRGRLMPPPDKPQPSQGEINTQVAWLEGKLDDVAKTHPNPGNVVVHRLNRTEYQREIRNLLDLDIDAAALLPKDTKADGFDNVATVLKVSPSFLDAYIVAASEVSMRAMGDAEAAPSSTVYRVTGTNPQDSHIEGLPLGTRGGLLAEHLFPADGEYTFNINQSGGGGGGYVAGLDTRHRMIFTIDGRKVFETEVGGEEDLKSVDQKQAPAAKAIRDRFANIKANVTAGPHKLGITWVARSFAQHDDLLSAQGPGGQPRVPGVFAVEVLGPAKATGLATTPSRKKIFICSPANEAEEAPCAKKIVENFASRAFRRPVTDQDMAAPLRFYEAGRKEKGFEAGIQQAVMAVLASPKFLYRVEGVPTDAQPGNVYAISDIELASRLSFFLWSQGPDQELMKAATSGKLRDPAEIDRQVRRMLKDPRSKSLTTSFADQWFTVDEIDAIEPDPALFPEFDNTLRYAFRKEIELFVDSVFSEDQSVIRLLDANYTFVNERLAYHYGIPNVRGDRFRRVELKDTYRYGLLGKGSFLMGMSYANRTSPVRRGAWILEQVMGTPPSAPPPGVEALLENKSGEAPKTVRERMVTHRANPTCNSCHGIIDPIGFSLEKFDAIGAYRVKDRETSVPIDSTDTIHGSTITGVDDLRNLLVAKPDQFVWTLTQKLMTYALGRGVEAHDMPTVRAIVRDAAAHDYKFSYIVAGIARSDPFTKQMIPTPAAPADVKTADASH